jgi:acylphosphatase
MKQQVHVFIHGLVQGVGYRIWTKKEADKLNLTGWVRNLPDSRVEAVFQGKTSIVKEMIQLCYQGPRLAQVDRIESRIEPLEDLSDFVMLPTPRA